MVFTARAIIEVIGHPEDHVNEISKKVLENLKKENGITIIKEEPNSAELVKENIYAAHVEVELKFFDLGKLLNFCYEYLPSEMQIIDAEKIVLSSNEMNNGLGEMLRRLHSLNLMLHNLNEANKELKDNK
ncbi:MAG: hypothetical protein AABX19_00020 [Nanoarchaeota archaeon]